MLENTELLELFTNTHKKMKREWIQQLEHALTLSQYFILKTLKQLGPCKGTELAEVVQITPGAITGAVDKLALEGYVERKGALGDRRIVYLEITDKGENFLDSVMRKQKCVMSRFFHGLSPEDMHHLTRIYRQIDFNIDHPAQIGFSNEAAHRNEG